MMAGCVCGSQEKDNPDNVERSALGSDNTAAGFTKTKHKDYNCVWILCKDKELQIKLRKSDDGGDIRIMV